MIRETKNIVGIKEAWSEFTLDDGTVIRAKGSITNAVFKGEYDDLGNPKYELNFSVTVDVQSPDHLKRVAAKAQAMLLKSGII